MPTLEDLLRRPRALEAVKEDAATLIRTLVREQRGLRGRTMRSGLMALESAHPGFLEASILRMLPLVAETLQAHYDQGAAGGDVPGYFASNEEKIADDLLRVTDGLAESTQRAWVARAYGMLRPQARAYVRDGLPQLANLLVKHLG